MLQPSNRIWLSFSAVNRMNIKSLISNSIITKSFSFYKQYVFDFTTIFNAAPFNFQYFDPTCLICYLVAS